MFISTLSYLITSSTNSFRHLMERLINEYARPVLSPVIDVAKKNHTTYNILKFFANYSAIIRQLIFVKKFSEDFRGKSKYSHFISVPTNLEHIKHNFLQFKMDLLKNCDLENSGFHENMFQKPEKLHFTICMLRLLEGCDEQRAIETLHQCKLEIINTILCGRNEPLEMELKGLKCMQKNFTKAKVLYIDVQEKSGLLQKIVEEMRSYFIQKGLSRKDHDKVTLHMTVINNVFHQRKMKQRKLPHHFNATNILNDYKDVNLGKINLSTFHLSSLFDKSPDGYFLASAKIYI